MSSLNNPLLTSAKENMLATSLTPHIKNKKVNQQKNALSKNTDSSLLGRKRIYSLSFGAVTLVLASIAGCGGGGTSTASNNAASSELQSLYSTSNGQTLQNNLQATQRTMAAEGYADSSNMLAAEIQAKENAVNNFANAVVFYLNNLANGGESVDIGSITSMVNQYKSQDESWLVTFSGSAACDCNPITSSASINTQYISAIDGTYSLIYAQINQMP